MYRVSYLTLIGWRSRVRRATCSIALLWRRSGGDRRTTRSLLLHIYSVYIVQKKQRPVHKSYSLPACLSLSLPRFTLLICLNTTFSVLLVSYSSFNFTTSLSSHFRRSWHFFDSSVCSLRQTHAYVNVISHPRDFVCHTSTAVVKACVTTMAAKVSSLFFAVAAARNSHHVVKVRVNV